MSDRPSIQHHIDGRGRVGELDGRGDVYDPARGAVTGAVALASPATVAAAVEASVRAAAEWRTVSITARTRILFRFRELIEQNKDDLARLITGEHGKVHADALGEVARGQEVVEFACGIGHLLKGDHSQNVSTEVDSYSVRQPLGVVAGITPFNFPVMVPMWMFPVAIACGNAFVLKPSERDPSPANMLAELFESAGLPAGVFNVVHGNKVAVDALLEHPDVAAISSVGSTPVARHIYETAARYGKRVQALGGAKNHMVVLPDADMDVVADAVMGAAYGSTGQRCMAVSAVVAVGDAGDRLVPRLQERIAALRIGPGTDPASEMGPLVSAEARDKVLSYVSSGVSEGAELAIDGSAAVEGRDGFFVGPCVFDHVSTDMRIYRDEIFGPVLVIVRAGTLEEALEVVNANPFGNGTAIFTDSGRAARVFQTGVEVGMVGINVAIPVPMAFYSFGGWKQSLFGDAHVHGMEGVRFYTRQKVVTARWPGSAGGGVNLGFPS